MTRLATNIKAMINKNGPMSLGQFFTIAMQDNDWGYYRHARPIGTGGDFTTAPEMTGLFGIILAMVIADFADKNNLKQVDIVEFGAGRGVLMRDIAQYLLKNHPQIQWQYMIIDINQPLMHQQRVMAEKIPIALQQYSNFDDYKPQNNVGVFVLANEFLDALAHESFKRVAGQWHIAQVGLKKNQQLTLFYAPYMGDDSFLPQHADYFEYCPEYRPFFAQLAGLHGFKNQFLLCDYGYHQPRQTPSIQAINRHLIVDIFHKIGQSDLSFHVDFNQCHQHVNALGGQLLSYQLMGEFLNQMGINQLLAKFPNQSDGVARITAPDGMGQIFKIFAGFF